MTDFSISAVRHYFEEQAQVWDSRLPPTYPEILRALVQPFAADFAAARRIVEVGTGTGALIPVLRALAPAAALISLDMAAAMAQQARLRCPDAWIVQADVHQVPAADASIDVVVCHNSFPHFTDPPRALAALRRILAPRGRLFILHNLPRARVNAIHQQAGPPIDGDLLPTGPDLHALLLASGFSAAAVDDGETHYCARATR